MKTVPLLTIEEAPFLSDAAEQWLGLRDVEINLGELAWKVLRTPRLIGHASGAVAQLPLSRGPIADARLVALRPFAEPGRFNLEKGGVNVQ